ncbi:MAG: TlpA family protein disulfide reductase [Tidjanibacter sp.]|nr:TlpA family protein disulfide reductase [Tidjanibacter sp.]
MKRLWAIVLSLAVALPLLGEDDPWARLVAGDRLPELSVELTDGTTITSADLEGKVVWIALWASWCPSCRKEFKRLAGSDEFRALTQRDGFLFLPIAREESAATVVAWLKEKGYPFVAAPDSEREVYSLFAEQEIPRNIIVDGQGVIRHHSSRYSRSELKAMATLAAELLEEATPQEVCEMVVNQPQ